MEKYIGYNNASSKGFSELSLLCDPKKMKRTDSKQSKDEPNKAVINTDKTYLESFKKSMLQQESKEINFCSILLYIVKFI